MSTIGNSTAATSSWVTSTRARASASALFAATSPVGGNAVTSAVQAGKNRDQAANTARQAAILTSAQKLNGALAKARYDSPGNLAVRFEDNYTEVPKYKQQSSYRTENVTRQEAIYTDRDIVERRDIIEQRDVYSERDVYETRGVYEDRPVYETRDVYEDRAIYEDRPVYETKVTGTKNVAAYDNHSEAGLNNNEDFSVKVGDGSAATIKFLSGRRISLTVNGNTTTSNYANGEGALGNALRTVLDSVAGLDARFDGTGKLQLQSTNAQAITIAEVSEGVLDFTGSPLAALGLTAGRTEASQTGTTRVQTGSERVKTGTEQVQVGTQSVQVGTEEVKTGTEQYVSGTQDVVVGQEDVVTGTERVQTGTQTVVTGTKQVVTGISYVRDGVQEVFSGTSVVRERASDSQATLTGASRKAILEATLALDTAFGPAKLNGLDNGYASLRDSFGIKKLKTISAQVDVSLASLRVMSALKSLQKQVGTIVNRTA